MIVALVVSPVQYFEARMNKSDPWAAFFTVASYTSLVALGTLLASGTMREATADALRDGGFPPVPAGMQAVLTAATVVAIPTQVALKGLALVVCDLLFSQSGRTRWLWQFTGECYGPQVLWSATVILATVLWFDPEPLLLAPES